MSSLMMTLNSACVYTTSIDHLTGIKTNKMRLFITALACLISMTMVGQTNTSDFEHCIEENHMFLDKINPNNRFKNRRQIQTTCSKEDFMILLKQYDLTCIQILVDHFYCDICFNANKNSITSYDGRKFLIEHKLPIDITNECLSLISNMRMGLNEHSKFINSHNTN